MYSGSHVDELILYHRMPLNRAQTDPVGWRVGGDTQDAETN